MILQHDVTSQFIRIYKYSHIHSPTDTGNAQDTATRIRRKEYKSTIMYNSSLYSSVIRAECDVSVDLIGQLKSDYSFKKMSLVQLMSHAS